MVNCALAAGCKNSWLPGGRHHCSECESMLYNLCVQSALKVEDMPDVWLRGTYSHTGTRYAIWQVNIHLKFCNLSPVEYT